MKPKTIKITLVDPPGNFLVCIACGKFHCDYAIATTLGEAQAGIHKKCFGHVKTTKAPPKKRLIPIDAPTDAFLEGIMEKVKATKNADPEEVVMLGDVMDDSYTPCAGEGLTEALADAEAFLDIVTEQHRREEERRLNDEHDTNPMHAIGHGRGDDTCTSQTIGATDSVEPSTGGAGKANSRD